METCLPVILLRISSIQFFRLFIFKELKNETWNSEEKRKLGKNRSTQRENFIQKSNIWDFSFCILKICLLFFKYKKKLPSSGVGLEK